MIHICRKKACCVFAHDLDHIDFLKDLLAMCCVISQVKTGVGKIHQSSKHGVLNCRVLAFKE